MLKTSLNFQNKNIHYINRPDCKLVSFTGSNEALKPFTKWGMTNKDQIVTSNNFVQRTNINEKKILQKLLDPKNTKPALITGRSEAGKSSFARKIALKLQTQGHNVICIDNNTTDSIKAKDRFEQLNNLIEQLKNSDSKERIFLFIDEPQFIPGIEERVNNNTPVLPADSILTKLLNLSKEKHNIKIIGVMYSGGFKYNKDEFDDLLKHLFPSKNHIKIPKMSLKDKINVINNILKETGFAPIPDYIEKKLGSCAKPVTPRAFLTELRFNIGYRCNGDINIEEEIRYEAWINTLKYFMPSSIIGFCHKIGTFFNPD